jgi:hypothetical protein
MAAMRLEFPPFFPAVLRYFAVCGPTLLLLKWINNLNETVEAPVLEVLRVERLESIYLGVPPPSPKQDFAKGCCRQRCLTQLRVGRHLRFGISASRPKLLQ